jgi:hypothetical protein
VITGADAGALDRAIGSCAAGACPGADTVGPDDRAAALSAWCVDGKALRGAKDTDGRQVRLPAVMEQERQLVVGLSSTTGGSAAALSR